MLFGKPRVNMRTEIRRIWQEAGTPQEIYYHRVDPYGGCARFGGIFCGKSSLC